MAYVPFAQEIGAVYTITSAGGAVAVLNNPDSVNYAGMLSEITGLDSADIRESASDRVESDGGDHGKFYFGRRPITMTVKVFGHGTALERAQKLDRLHRAATALRADSMMTWEPTYAPGVGLQIPVRLQQPIRDTGPWAKDVQVALVSAQAVIQSQTQHTSAWAALNNSATITVENRGSYEAFPLIEIAGASTNPRVANTNGDELFTGPTGYTLSLASGETVQIDTLNHTATFTAGARSGQSANRYINFSSTLKWPKLYAAGNTVFSGSGGGTFRLLWRDAWH